MGEMREEFYAGLEDRKYLPISQARNKAPQIDWKDSANMPIKPSFFGTKSYVDFPIEDVLKAIDWNPFFSVWQLRGRYPNRGYPKIFLDETVGAEAKKLHADALALLKTITSKKRLRLKGVVAFYPAASVGDDIVVWENDEAREQGKPPVKTFFTLRQQAEKDTDEPTYSALSDFVAPRDSGVKDYIGGFVASAGFGMDELVEEFKAASDDYSHIMVEALADRLAEAFAEVLHQMVRKDLWGYAPSEDLDTDALLKVSYQGIRPAPGYPSQPDHTEKATMWELMKVDENIGVKLTESLAMLPAASVSGLYFGGKCAEYFNVGKISKDQVVDYAMRKKQPIDVVEKWLGPVLAYEA